MRCDGCGEDHSFLDLQPTGRFRHSDTLFTVRRYRELLCEKCIAQQAVNEYSQVSPKTHNGENDGNL